MFDHQSGPMISADFPSKLEPLFVPKRYKVMFGGRGAGRSWGAARALLLMGTQRSIRVLCAREFQNSIEESVHKVLSDQIVALGLSDFYNIQLKKIEGKNGTSFSFEGIRNNTTRIKSYEGIDYCWVEEANKVTKSSWGILIPTIRKTGSEIWITFNPELETDYTYRRFVLDADDSMFVIKMTYRDNKWFPKELQDEMERDKLRDYDYYLNVWEGNCLQQLEGAVYAKELRRAQEEGRITRVPWDRQYPVDTWWDLGRADRTAIWFTQRVAMQWRVIDYLEDSGEDISYYLKELQRKEYFYRTLGLPHDAKAKKIGSKRSVEEIARGYKMGDVKIIPKLSVTDGINAARIIFPTVWFDEKKCSDGLGRLRHYRFRVVDGHLSNEPLHDDASDGADAWRYFAVGAREPATGGLEIKRRLELAAAALRGEAQVEFSGRGEGRTGLGWLGH